MIDIIEEDLENFGYGKTQIPKSTPRTTTKTKEQLMDGIDILVEKCNKRNRKIKKLS